MKKYKVLNSHPFLLPGIILAGEHDHNFFQIENFNPTYSSTIVSEWNSRQWIEEIQTPVWTDRDMISFVIFHDTTHSSPTDSLNMFKTGMLSKD